MMNFEFKLLIWMEMSRFRSFVCCSCTAGSLAWRLSPSVWCSWLHLYQSLYPSSPHLPWWISFEKSWISIEECRISIEKCRFHYEKRRSARGSSHRRVSHSYIVYTCQWLIDLSLIAGAIVARLASTCSGEYVYITKATICPWLWV